MSARDDYPIANDLASTGRFGAHASRELGKMLDEIDSLRIDRDSQGWMIRRAWGGSAGPFYTREAALPYLNAGDELYLCNEHGNCIDYAPQFDGEDQP